MLNSKQVKEIVWKKGKISKIGNKEREDIERRRGKDVNSQRKTNSEQKA